MKPDKNLLRHIPKVNDCLIQLSDREQLAGIPLNRIKKCTRAFLDSIRQDLLAGKPVDPGSLEGEEFLEKLSAYIIRYHQPRFKRVINATGVIIHTNLGRSVLPDMTMDELHRAGLRYSNLEFDLQTGERGSRYSLVEELLCELTGAEAALVVNNNAAAVLIVLDTLAKGREAIVSRGQLVEIGGSFRIPDVMARSGACLVEVGATNRTHLQDYREAITEHTGLLMKVHCSNYRIIGFTSEVANEELVALGRECGVPVMEDLGSGCFVDLSRFGLMREPTVQEVVRSGVDVVTFSGDKLLGGPQAGVIVGGKRIIDLIKKNPLNRALRIDKFTLAGLESILRFYLDSDLALQRIPTLSMIAAPVALIEKRARAFIEQVEEHLQGTCVLTLRDAASRVGGGAMPEQSVASKVVAIAPTVMSVNGLEQALRQMEIPVIGRVEEDRLLLDMRTVAEDELDLLAAGLCSALRASV